MTLRNSESRYLAFSSENEVHGPHSRAAVLHFSSAPLLVVLLFIGSAALSCHAQAQQLQTSELPARLRRPVALVLSDNGKVLFVANHRNGAVSVIDTTALRTATEVQVGKSLSDLASISDGRHLVALDEGANELVLLAHDGTALNVVARSALATSPVSVKISADGSMAFVALLWVRALAIVEIATQEKIDDRAKLRIRKTIPLPFAPRKQMLVRHDSKLIVADSFGGKLAVMDVARQELESVRTLPAHNIRGLALTPDGRSLLISHQLLSSLAHTTVDDIHWGNLIGNNLRVLALEAVLANNSDLLRDSQVIPLGEVNEGGADPGEILVTPHDEVVVSLGGIGKVAVGSVTNGVFQRVPVGQRPSSLALTADGKNVYVASTFSDSVSVMDLNSKSVLTNISLGPQSELSLSDRGEILFYDARLSHNGWLSCQSCHTDGHSNGLLNDNLGDGSFGAPKKVLSLLGVADTGPWAWNGSIRNLDDQIHKSILTTMRGAEPSIDQVSAIAAFLRTLQPPSPVPNLTGDSVKRGESIFREQGCATCHVPPEYTSGKTYDVGLQDEVGNTKFNPPSLRGLSQRDLLFHDNRAKTLEEVVSEYRHQLSAKLSKQDVSDLVDFLRSL